MIESLDRPKDIRDVWDLNSSSATNSSRSRTSRADAIYSSAADESFLRRRQEQYTHRLATRAAENGSSAFGFSSVSPYASSILGQAFKTAHHLAPSAPRPSDRWGASREPQTRSHREGGQQEDKQLAYRIKAQQSIDSVLHAAAQRFALEETLRRCQNEEADHRSEVTVEWEDRAKQLRLHFFAAGLKVVEAEEVRWRAVFRCGEELEATELCEIAAQIRQAAVEDYWRRRVMETLRLEESHRLDCAVAEELNRFALYCQCQSTLLSMHSGAMKNVGAEVPGASKTVSSSEGKTLGRGLLAPLPSLAEEARSLEPSPFLPSLSFSGSINLALSNSASYRPQRRPSNSPEDPLSLSLTLTSSMVERSAK